MSAMAMSSNMSKRPQRATVYQWPHPERSIGDRCGSLGFLGKYKCWKTKDKSPAYLVWKSISGPILRLLEDQYEHLDAKDKQLQVEMFMVGKEPTSARPTILFSCQSKICRRRAMELVQKHAMLVRHPGVVMAECAKLPVALAKDSLLDSDLEPGVYANGSVNRIGISILIIGAKGTSTRKATLGGFVRMDDGFYGLTAKHGFSLNMNAHNTEEVDDDEFAFYEYGDSDERSDGEYDSVEITSHGSLSSSSTESRSSDTHNKSIQSSQTPNPEDHITATPSAVAGKFKSDELPKYNPSDIENQSFAIGKVMPEIPLDEGLDWALVELRKDSELFQNLSSSGLGRDVTKEPWCKDIFVNKFTFQDGTSCLPKKLAVLPRDAEVVIFSGNSVLPLRGKLSAVSAYIKPQGCIRFQELWTVTYLDDYLAEGDSGSWVVDKELSLLYGHITAGFPATRSAYLVPAIHSFSEIQDWVGPISLPTPANWTAEDTGQLGLEILLTGPSQLETGSHSSRQESKNKASEKQTTGPAPAIIPHISPSVTASEGTIFSNLQPKSTRSQDSKISLTPGFYINNPASRVLYMGNLPGGVTKAALTAIFSQQDGYVDLYLGIDGTGPRCYITFKDIHSASKAMHELLVPGFDIDSSRHSGQLEALKPPGR